jgi:hypothetical protein
MIPCRSRPSTKRSRAKPPSFLLTSIEHCSFLESKTTKKTKNGSKKTDAEGKKEKSRETKQCTKRKATNQEGNKMKRKPSQLPALAVSKKTSSDNDRPTDAADNTPCNYCEIPYFQSNVAWYKCSVCDKWVCGSCAHVGRKSKNVFICCDCK